MSQAKHVKSFLLSSILYSDSLHSHIKRRPINIPLTLLMVRTLVHRASLSFSLSMLPLSTLFFGHHYQTLARFKQTSPFISVNYHPLLAMSGSSASYSYIYWNIITGVMESVTESSAVRNAILNGILMLWNMICTHISTLFCAIFFNINFHFYLVH